jgi:hypothetical protein
VAKAPRRKLKVFQARFGFHDSVVAAPSQAAALRAWGVRQNLFAEGQARLADDPVAEAAARARPEIPLRRAVGSAGPFDLTSRAGPAMPGGPRRKTAKARSSSKPAAPRPPPDRSDLDAAEAALHALDEQRRLEAAELRRRQADLDRDLAERRAAYVAGRKTASAAVEAARKAYRKAGGRA